MKYSFYINLDFSNYFLIINSFFYYCYSSGGGAFYVDSNSNFTLKYCIFESCYSTNTKTSTYGRSIAGGGSFLISCLNIYCSFLCIINCSSNIGAGAFYLSTKASINNFIFFNNSVLTLCYSNTCNGLIDNGNITFYNNNGTNNETPGEAASFHFGRSVTDVPGYKSLFLTIINNKGKSIYGGLSNKYLDMLTLNSNFLNNTAINGIIQFWSFHHLMINCFFLNNIGRTDYSSYIGCTLTFINCSFDNFIGTGYLNNSLITNYFLTYFLNFNNFCFPLITINNNNNYFKIYIFFLFKTINYFGLFL